MVECGWSYRQGSTHISSPDTGPVQMETPAPGSAAASAADGWGGGGGAGWGGGGPSLGSDSFALARWSLGLPVRAPGEPLPHTAPQPRLHPASPLFPPLPQFTRMGRREESWPRLGGSVSPPEALGGEVVLASFGRWGNRGSKRQSLLPKATLANRD